MWLGAVGVGNAYFPSRQRWQADVGGGGKGRGERTHQLGDAPEIKNPENGGEKERK